MNARLNYGYQLGRALSVKTAAGGAKGMAGVVNNAINWLVPAAKPAAKTMAAAPPPAAAGRVAGRVAPPPPPPPPKKVTISPAEAAAGRAKVTVSPTEAAASMWEGATGEGRRRFIGAGANANIPGIHTMPFDALTPAQQQTAMRSMGYAKPTAAPTASMPAPPPPPPPPAKVTISPAEAAAGRAKVTVSPAEAAAARPRGFEASGWFQ